MTTTFTSVKVKADLLSVCVLQYHLRFITLFFTVHHLLFHFCHDMLSYGINQKWDKNNEPQSSRRRTARANVQKQLCASHTWSCIHWPRLITPASVIHQYNIHTINWKWLLQSWESHFINGSYVNRRHHFGLPHPQNHYEQPECVLYSSHLWSGREISWSSVRKSCRLFLSSDNFAFKVYFL